MSDLRAVPALSPSQAHSKAGMVPTAALQMAAFALYLPRIAPALIRPTAVARRPGRA